MYIPSSAKAEILTQIAGAKNGLSDSARKIVYYLYCTLTVLENKSTDSSSTKIQLYYINIKNIKIKIRKRSNELNLATLNFGVYLA